MPKKQNTAESATYESEFMVSRQATEHIIDISYTLLMMGIPIEGPSWMFGDNQGVITSSTIPQSYLNKRHNALSYHRVRKCIDAGIIYFMYIESIYHPADVLTKCLGRNKFWPLIQPILFWKGETMLKGTAPISSFIKHIKNDTHSGLRGVSGRNGHCSHFDNN